MNKIDFILPKQFNEVGISSPPKPAKTYIPQKYKELVSYRNNDLRYPTVKKCMPFLDALTSGYIIPFFEDYVITVDYEKHLFDMRTAITPPKFHESNQLPENYQDGAPIGKFMNKWLIKTPPGYSCLFVHPMNTPKAQFECVSGVVDTDVYDQIIHFPFYWKEWNEKGQVQAMLKKNDSMIQVIPFKRESWKSWVGERNLNPNNNWTGYFKELYKKYYWKKKKYE